MDSRIKIDERQQPLADGGGTLNGWKEIAGYFGRDIRSVQRWERLRGLPVRRISSNGRGGRPAVQARSRELDDWLRGPAAPPDARAEPAPAPPRAVVTAIRRPGTKPGQGCRGWLRMAFRPTQGWALAGLLLLTGIIVAGTAILWGDQDGPESVVLEPGFTLVARDAGGMRLWQRDFIPKHATTVVDDGAPPLLVDLNHDSRKEVIFSYITGGEDFGDQDRVICLDEEGRELWWYYPGGAVVMGGVNVPNFYQIRGVSATGLRAGGGHFVVVIANSRILAASQASILDSAGRRIGEYWHAGRILDLEIVDVNHDGVDEIALAGVDEQAGKAFVALIAPDTPKSISPVPNGYAPGLEAHRELAYLLFPVSLPASILGRQNCALKVEQHRHPESLRVEIQQQGGERDVVERTYLLDAQLKLVRLQLSDEFLLQAQRLQQAKLLPPDWHIDEVARLRQIQPVARK